VYAGTYGQVNWHIRHQVGFEVGEQTTFITLNLFEGLKRYKMAHGAGAPQSAENEAHTIL
jgi:hypothetical protein